MPNPNEVGADRLVNTVAIGALYQIPAIVIDFGTATTFDVINEKGAYCGGAIAPGVNLSIDTLHKAAAQLPSVELENPGAVCGKNTVEAMQSGLYWGYIGLVEGLVQRLSDEMGVSPFVIATGGLAPIFADNIPVIEKVDETLTLKGLWHIYLENFG